jgi:hypothetical protein
LHEDTGGVLVEAGGEAIELLASDHVVRHVTPASCVARHR